MSRLSLSDFEDTLDPEVLDAAREYFDFGYLRNIEAEDDKFWAAEFDQEGEEGEISLEIKRGQVSTVSCTCADFDPDDWAETPCIHQIALMYAAIAMKQTKKTAAKKEKPAKGKATAKKDLKKVPAKKKDPAEALLDELETKEVYNFLRQMLSKNKEFKSQFLLHFSERSGAGAQQFDDIVANAIAAVKGRRKYLQGADGAKIATALTVLYKQAANSESRGYFREAFQICMTFLKHLPDVFVVMEKPSAKLETLLANTLELIAQIIKNPETPFEFRDELFETLLKEYERFEKVYAGQTKIEVFLRLKDAARLTKRQSEVVTLMRSLVQFYKAMGKKSHWSNEYHGEINLIDRLADYLQNEMKTPDQAIKVLEENKEHLVFYLKLVEHKTEAGDFNTAIAYLNDIKKNIRKYQSEWGRWDLEKKINELLLGVYRKRGDKEAIAPLAGNLFAESHYLDFAYYDLEKSVTPADRWPKRVEYYLKQTRPTQFRAAIFSTPFFEILTREERWEQLRDEICQSTNLQTWERYGDAVKKRYPDVYLKQQRKNIEMEVKDTWSSHLPLVAKTFQEMAALEGGAAIVREMLADFRRQYGQRRELMRVLDRVKI